MEDRRGDDSGRREDDARWLKVQKDVMSLVTATRESQRGIAKLEIEVGKISDHVEEVDDHLRGVAGKESLDTRVSLLEKEFEMHGVLLRRISDQFTELHSWMDNVKSQLSHLTIVRAITEKSEASRMDKFREWLKFWGAIILASLALIAPLTKLAFDNWDKIRAMFHREKQTVESLQKEIDADKKGPRGKAVRKKLREIEQAAQGHE